MVMYDNSVHALQDLVQSGSIHGGACRITKLSQNVSLLENGIEYCIVEVTCDNGEQYGIQAYGKEAIELHKEALKHDQPSSKKEVVLVS